MSKIVWSTATFMAMAFALPCAIILGSWLLSMTHDTWRGILGVLVYVLGNVLLASAIFFGLVAAIARYATHRRLVAASALTGLAFAPLLVAFSAWWVPRWNPGHALFDCGAGSRTICAAAYSFGALLLALPTSLILVASVTRLVINRRRA
jgi:hypothetical protein